MPVVTKWRVNKLSDETYELRSTLNFFADPIRIWDHYPSEAEIESALVNSVVLR